MVVELISLDNDLVKKYAETFCYNETLLDAVLTNNLLRETKKKDINSAVKEYGNSKCAEILNRAMRFELDNFKVEKFCNVC